MDICREYIKLFGKENLDMWALDMAFGHQKATERIERAIREKKPIDWPNELEGWDEYKKDMENPDISF